MAKIFSAPVRIKTPNLSLTGVKYDVEVKRYTDEVRAWVKSVSKHRLAGEILRFPVADGYAQYMVFSGTELIHLDIGDGYQIPAAHARGLRIAEEVEHATRFRKFIDRLPEAVEG